jgi:hypothetical protein
MKQIILLQKSLAALLLLAPVALPAQQMNYQGRLTDANGDALPNGTQSVTFSLWDAASGGNQVWGPYAADGGSGNGHSPLANIINGRFNVALGPLDTAARPLSGAFNGAADRYLEIKVGSNAPITPRQKLLAAPTAVYATKAASADTAANFTSVVLKTDEINQRVGVGTANPAVRLEVAGQLATTGPAGELAFHNRSDNTKRSVWWSDSNGAHLWVHEVPRMTIVPSTGAVNFSGPVNSSSGIKSNGSLAQLAFANRDNAAKSSIWYSNSTGAHLWVDDVGDKLTVAPSGNVAIGSTDTSKAKLAVFGFVANNPDGAITFNAYTKAGVGPVIAASPQAVSIYTDQVIWTGEFLIASSDERIKVIEGISDKAADLKTLQDINITDYRYRDTIAKGSVPQKKVIAQQVEKVFPQAVSKQTDVVPDIYKAASCKDGWVELDTDLKKGEHVKLISEKSGEKIEEVLEVAPGKFRTAFQPAGEKVFVYGRQVNDFRTVDYDAIAMLNVSATQELARKLEAEHASVLALQKENAALRATLEQQLATQAAKDKSRDEQLAAIVTLLEARTASTVTTTASVK